MQHDQVKTLLQNGDWRDADTHDAVKAHLASCADCAAFQKLLVDLNAWQPERRSFSAEQRHQLTQQLLPRVRPPSRLSIAAPQFATALAVVALFLLSGVVWMVLNPPSVPLAVDYPTHTYDGWELGVTFDFPADWRPHAFIADHDGSDNAFIEFSNIDESMRETEPGDDEPTLQNGQQVVLVNTFPLGLGDGLPDQELLQQAHMMWSTDLDSADPLHVEEQRIGQYDVLSSSGSVRNAGQAIYTLLVEGRIMNVLGVTAESDLESLTTRIEHLIGSMESADYTDWQHIDRDLTDSMSFGTVVYPKSWDAWREGRRVVLAPDQAKLTGSATNDPNSVTAPIVEIEPRIAQNYRIGDPVSPPLERLNLEVAISSLIHQPVDSPYLLTGREEIGIGRFTVGDGNNTGRLIAIVNLPVNASQVYPIKLTATLPAAQVDDFLPTFERIARSVGYINRHIMVEPAQYGASNP